MFNGMNLLPQLADFTANVEANQLGIWLFCLFAVLGILNQGAAFISRFRDQPPASEKYATKREVSEVREEMNTLRNTLVENYNKIMESSADARRRLYEAINAVAAGVHRIEGAMDAARKK